MFTEIQKQVQIWHTQQGHINQNTQLTNLIEELGEVAKELSRNDEQALKTELGDVLIVLISLDQINNEERDLRQFLKINLVVCADKKAFLIHHMHNELKSCNTTAHGINFVKRLGYDPTECLELAWNKEQAKTSVSIIMPRPEDFGYYESCSFEEQSGWQLEGGEEAYYETYAKWEKEQAKTAKLKLIGGFNFINRYELLLNGMIVFGDSEMVNFMPEKPHQPKELRVSPMKLGNIEPNRWFISGNTACLILSVNGINAIYKAFELKGNGGFEMRFCVSSAGDTVDLIH